MQTDNEQANHRQAGNIQIAIRQPTACRLILDSIQISDRHIVDGRQADSGEEGK